MKIERRDFLKLGMMQAVALGLPQKTDAQVDLVYKKGPSILQGATDDTKTQFNIVHDADVALEIFVTDSQGRRWNADDIRSITFPRHTKQILKAYFSNLHPDEVFYLNLVDTAKNQVIDQREFRTLNLDKPSLSFALCSCMDEKQHEPEIWRNMVAKNPDILFFIGDSVYADSGAGSEGANPYYLWQRFCEARTTLEIYYSKKLIPILATWDDHDFRFE